MSRCRSVRAGGSESYRSQCRDHRSSPYVFVYLLQCVVCSYSLHSAPDSVAREIGRTEVEACWKLSIRRRSADPRAIVLCAVFLAFCLFISSYILPLYPRLYARVHATHFPDGFAARVLTYLAGRALKLQTSADRRSVSRSHVVCRRTRQSSIDHLNY